MRKITIIIYCMAVVVLFVKCTNKMRPAEKEPTSKKAVKTQVPKSADTAAAIKYTAAQLAQGETIYGQKCGTCHDFHEPGDLKVSEWNNVLPVMVHRAKLTAEDAELVKAWIITNAKQG